ncbi:hypothetical protein R3P38DRAFT_3478496 [Favolaschia claudopus]|uniref:Uncharacterized protein n=1 Tax=Favolaschia claudopus TaxID=2862362 RepID=A0AAV9Z9H4_9AGAR
MSDSETPSAKEQLTRSLREKCNAQSVATPTSTSSSMSLPGARMSSFIPSRFESSYARPAMKTTSVYFDEYPITSTFVIIFSSLTIFPVLTFIALSLFTILSLSFLALCCAFVVSSAVILFFLSILILCVITAFFASGFFTALAISTYPLVAFLETKTRFIRPKRREPSDESAVVVDMKEAPSEDILVGDVKQENL